MPTPPPGAPSPPPVISRSSPPHFSTEPHPGLPLWIPRPATDQSNTRIGTFWHTSTWQTGQTITHHAGQTGGYASYLALDRHAHRAVIVLSDVANDAGDLGKQLLADRTKGTS